MGVSMSRSPTRPVALSSIAAALTPARCVPRRASRRATRGLPAVPWPRNVARPACRWGEMAAAPDPTRFRAQFPVLERLGYLNAGTEGPMPQAAADAVRERVDGELSGGRAGPAYMNRV